jgi:hypothetical protein
MAVKNKEALTGKDLLAKVKENDGLTTRLGKKVRPV